MTLGEYIREKRAAMALSQPQLAEQIGIEQSYLSKLENDKSLPSNDVFRRLLNAVETPLPHFVAAFSVEELQQLTAIADIEHFVKQKNQKQQRHSAVLVLSLSFIFALGAACFYAGFQALCFPEKLYQYQSQGVVLPGESAFVFTDWDRYFPISRGSDEAIRQSINAKAEQEQLMYKRLAQISELSFEHKGEYYVRPAEGGSRTFMYKGGHKVERVGNTVLQLLGLFLMVFSTVLSFGRKSLQNL
ncbi:MAG: helix-turn-helix domain-containing protein [Gammaproteobacteria bacterium]|nr:helix-turn-helix domain-containing protein [Gammaproteobacteria bacterium]MBU2057272.1 helix-turn-helix domain-containing protein [Gammaproteobacteria bacterium]MBU2174874.1 helix-turn-helix domain-containing protein [Gammaproteobacteria bacterium]MBU2245479.1 helix-turn-helix domain-containing protein [Gammaproteobacteria bacterium]MBU2344487.1 helix-turn-helix domain-containing protein [Gammaproteobacteria bacterium]